VTVVLPPPAAAVAARAGRALVLLLVSGTQRRALLLVGSDRFGVEGCGGLSIEEADIMINSSRMGPKQPSSQAGGSTK
jgi:hypothetical protein